jgi:hypothetical protein
MSRRHALAAAVAIILVSGLRDAGADINDGPKDRRISITGSKEIVLPKDDWIIGGERRRPDGNGVYYMLSSERRQLSFSVFVERTTVCESPQSCLALALKNPQYKDAIEMRQNDEGAFRAATFYLDQPSGAPIQQAHVLASAYVDGVWFDVHISRGAKERPDMGTLLEFLRQVAIR